MRKILLNCFVAFPLAAVVLFINSAFINGNAGLKLDKTQNGFLVSDVSKELNPVKPGDLITSIHGLSYHEFLGAALTRTPLKKPGEMTVRHGSETISFDLCTVPYKFSSLLDRIWPRLLLILTFLTLGLIAIHRAPPSPQVRLFFFMLCSFSVSLSVTIPSSIGLLSPAVYSSAFMVHVIANWASFGLWAHFALRFPAARDLVKHRWWIPLCIYLLPALTTVGGAFFAAGLTPEFWGWVQRLRNMYLPIIIMGVFIKHALDYRRVPAAPEKNYIKLTIFAYWLTFAPYLFFHLLPNLLFNRPLISFRIAVFAFFVLPVVYLVGVLQYRFFNIDRFISRSLAYFTLAISLLILYSISLIGLQKWFFGEKILSKELFVIFLVFINFLFHPIIIRLDRLIKRLFFDYQTISAEAMNRLSGRVSASLHLSDLVRLVTKDLPEAFHIEAAAIVTLKAKITRLMPEYRLFTAIPRSNSHLAKLLRTSSMPFISTLQSVGDEAVSAELARIHRAGFSLVLPLRSSSALTALLLIGHKKNGRSFHSEEEHLLASFANQTAVALENAVHYASLVESKKQLEDMFHQTVQAEKMATIGKMTAMLTHELKNPLGIIHSSAQYLLDGKQSGTVTREMLQYIRGEAEHLNLTIESILKLARQKPPEFEKVDLSVHIPQLMARWRRSNSHRADVFIDIHVSETLPPAYLDPKQLGQVLMNLTRNSEAVMTNGGRITIDVRRDREMIRIQLADTGPGIPEENMDRIFQQFFTTREEGLGLGLAVCRQIITAHNGDISLKNRTGGGVSACIRIPVRPPAVMESHGLQKAALSVPILEQGE